MHTLTLYNLAIPVVSQTHLYSLSFLQTPALNCIYPTFLILLCTLTLFPPSCIQMHLFAFPKKLTSYFWLATVNTNHSLCLLAKSKIFLPSNDLLGKLSYRAIVQLMGTVKRRLIIIHITRDQSCLWTITGNIPSFILGCQDKFKISFWN